MARRNAASTATSTEEATTPDTTQESTVAETTTTEATEAPATEATEAPATEATEAKAEVAIDLTEFTKAVEAAVEQRDAETGALSAEVIESVNAVYRDLDGGVKAKNAAKKSIEDAMLKAVGDLQIQVARAYGDIKGNLSAAGGSSTSTPKAPADPAAAYVARMAALAIATNLASDEAPEVAEDRDLEAEITKAVQDAAEQVAAYKAHLAVEVPEGEDKPEAPEVSPLVRQAFKLATGKATGGARRSNGGGSGVRRSVANHITSAFADLASGDFLTIAQIANHKSTEYGDDSPSQGAISARLFPESGNSTVEGVVPQDKDEAKGYKGRGAVKA